MLTVFATLGISVYRNLWYNLKQKEPVPEIKLFLWNFSNLIIPLVSPYLDTKAPFIFLYEGLSLETNFSIQETWTVVNCCALRTFYVSNTVFAIHTYLWSSQQPYKIGAHPLVDTEGKNDQVKCWDLPTLITQSLNVGEPGLNSRSRWPRINIIPWYFYYVLLSLILKSLLPNVPRNERLDSVRTMIPDQSLKSFLSFGDFYCPGFAKK